MIQGEMNKSADDTMISISKHDSSKFLILSSIDKLLASLSALYKLHHGIIIDIMHYLFFKVDNAIKTCSQTFISLTLVKEKM